MAAAVRVPTRRRPLDRPLAMVGLAAGVVVVIELALFASAEDNPPVYSLFTLTGVVYLATGLLAWQRRPANGLGPLLTGGAFLFFVVALGNTQIPLLVALGQVFATIVLALIVHLLLAFPSGRVTSRTARLVVLAGYAVCLVLQAPIYLFGSADPPFDLLQITSRPDLVETARTVQSLAGILVMVATTALLVGRWRSAEPRHRRVLGPLYAFGVLTVLAEPLAPRLMVPAGASPSAVALVQLALSALIPTVFTWCVLRGGFSPTQEVDELAAWLGESGTRPRIEQALAGALGDPTLQVRYAPESAPSHTVDQPPTRSTVRDVVEVTVQGRPVAWISYDATLIADRDQVAAAGRVVAIELDRERLTAELLDRSHELEQSRSRIAQAEEEGRRRIARDLHDGLQVQLVRLAIDAGRLADASGATPELASEAGRLRTTLDQSAADLRRLVQGLMPALLIERGLFAATEDLLDATPFRVDLKLKGTDQGLVPAVESAAYFVIAEAIANAIKHSGAQAVCVSIDRAAAGLGLEVVDDGRGGARLDDGTGLRGLADRLDVLGGTLHVTSPPGGGTRLTAEIPCAS